MPYSKEQKEKTNKGLDRLIEETDLKVGRTKIHGPTLLSKIIIGIKKRIG